MSILHIFFVIIALLAVSVALTVVALLYHSRISSRLNNLEKDIEKKTLEFDALKKDRAAGSTPVHHDSPADMHTKVFEIPLSQEMQQPVAEEEVEGGSIQIVRNVRGTFETTDTVMGDHGYAVPADEPVMSVVQPKIIASPHPSPAAPVQRAAQPPVQSGTVIPLLSKTTGAPDFNLLYQLLVDAMKTSFDPVFSFDLAGIESLSDGEIEYLEKIYHSLVGQRRSLVLLHCSGNLAALIRRRPAMAPLIR